MQGWDIWSMVTEIWALWCLHMWEYGRFHFREFFRKDILKILVASHPIIPSVDTAKEVGCRR